MDGCGWVHEWVGGRVGVGVGARGECRVYGCMGGAAGYMGGCRGVCGWV